MYREDVIKGWILETIKDTVHSAKLEKDALLRNPSLTVSYSNNKLTQLSKNILEAIKNEGKFELLESGEVKTLD